MPSKSFMLDGDLEVTIHKRKRSRHLRITITPSGEIMVSIPAWAPYKAGLEFAKSRYDWIRSQPIPVHVLKQGQAVGKAHHLEFVASVGVSSPSARLVGSVIQVKHPVSLARDDPKVQKAAQTACIRALRKQAENLLPQRLAMLAELHGFSYNTVSVKRLKSRWGSCDQHKRIVLNLYLMQLPWELIDYVLLHELTHTQILKHGPEFWNAMKDLLPGVADLRKALRGHQPILTGG